MSLNRHEELTEDTSCWLEIWFPRERVVSTDENYSPHSEGKELDLDCEEWATNLSSSAPVSPKKSGIVGREREGVVEDPPTREVVILSVRQVSKWKHQLQWQEFCCNRLQERRASALSGCEYGTITPSARWGQREGDGGGGFRGEVTRRRATN